MSAQASQSTVIPRRGLLWFAKDGVTIDLNHPSTLDMYVQQVITRGGTEDVKNLLRQVEPDRLRISLNRIARFLPDDVRGFWEEYLGNSR